MDRQPLGLLLTLLAAGGLGACQEEIQGRHAFDGPGAVAFLGAGEGPFDDAVGFVANTRGGTVVPVDLKHLSLLADQHGAPWLDPRWVATGDVRQLGQLVAWTPEPDAVTVFVADLTHDVLVEAPYVTGVQDGEPVLYSVEATDPVFLDNDASGDSAALSGLELRAGATTTEDWLLDFDGDVWWVTGSRSGKQGTQAEPGELFVADNHEVEFTVEGSASSGDTITFSTDTGVVEHDLGGTILGLARVPETDLLLAAVWDALALQGSLVLWDMRASVSLGSVALPEGAQPWRLAFGPAPADGDAWVVYVADSHLPVVHTVALDTADPAASTLGEIATSGPVAALAWVGDEGDETFGRAPYSHLFVAPADANRVDVLDLDAQEWLDVNPLDGVVGGLPLVSPVVGLSASAERVPLQQLSNWGGESDKMVVGVTTFDGAFMMFEGDTGCLAIDMQGPSVTTTTSGVETIEFSDRGPESDPYLYTDPATGRQVIPNGCGGVVRREVWTLTYDGVEGNWQVEGSISGLQQNRAWEDQRYATDQGELTFMILSGAAATTDGDSYQFEIDDGLLRIESWTTRSGSTANPIELPAAPLVVHYDAGPTGGGWDEDRSKPMALVPVTNSDLLLRIRLDAWQVEAVWD